jgi:protocatechuate 3,4-dioxygenase beta subunit
MTNEQPITRRQAVKTAGAAGAVYLLAPTLAGSFPAAALAASATTAATASAAKLTPELTEGPYWVNTRLHRSNVLANSHGGGHQHGVSLKLYINVFQAATRKPMNDLAVDIWHANAHGLYSDETSQQAGGGTSGSDGDTIADNWLRGYQITGRDRGLHKKPVHGQVSFDTIWPGWYTGRAIHIHVRVRKVHSSGATIAGYTTQIFFSDADNTHVLTNAAPYTTRSPQTDPTTDENDTVLTSADHATNVVAVKGSVGDGYTAVFNIAAEVAEVGATGSLSRPTTGGGGPGGAGGPGAGGPGGGGPGGPGIS